MPPSPFVVLITGASSGIGRATAARLARDGHTVYASARRPETLEALAAAGCTPIGLDVTDPLAIDRVVSDIERRHGAIDILVNNAGYSQSGAVERVTPAELRAQFATNVFGPTELTQRVLPAMRAQRRGYIINISSIGGRLVFPGGGAYHATKFALEALSDALRFELAGFGIHVVLIEPGLIRTAFGDTAASSVASTSTNDPYRDFHAEVARITTESYSKGSLAPFASEPSDVANLIARVITTAHPRPRYVVSPSAVLLLGLRRLLPDRWWDRFLARTYPRPGIG